MSRIIFTVVAVTVTVATASYFVVTKTDLFERRAEAPTATPPESTSSNKSPHGDFHKRFQPTLPSKEAPAR
jgi:hypothetical protein